MKKLMAETRKSQEQSKPDKMKNVDSNRKYMKDSGQEGGMKIYSNTGKTQNKVG